MGDAARLEMDDAAGDTAPGGVPAGVLRKDAPRNASATSASPETSGCASDHARMALAYSASYAYAAAAATCGLEVSDAGSAYPYPSGYGKSDPGKGGLPPGVEGPEGPQEPERTPPSVPSVRGGDASEDASEDASGDASLFVASSSAATAASPLASCSVTEPVSASPARFRAIAAAAKVRKLGAPRAERSSEGLARANGSLDGSTGSGNRVVAGEYGPGEGGTNGENPSADAGSNPGLYAA